MKKSILSIASLLFCAYTYAQTAGNSNAVTEPLGAQYYLNPYLANPAFAGVDSGLHINLAYRKQWTDMPGAPQTKLLTADYFVGSRVGVGLQVYNDVAGLISNTRIAATYAYHLPLNDNGHTLHFGISGVLYNKRLNIKDINGDMNDPAANAFNRRDNYFESDFGMAYTNKHLGLQAALSDMISHLHAEDKEAGTQLFYAAADYRFEVSEAVPYIIPKVAWRGVQGMQDIIDAGVKVVFLRNWLDATGIYHSNGSFSAGAGFSYPSLGTLQFMYNTQTGGFRNYSNGGMELHLKINLFQ